MEPRTLTQGNFRTYRPLAQKLACDHLELLRALPLVLGAVLLREVIDYDFRFPRERAVIDARFAFLEGLSDGDRSQLTSGFAGLTLDSSLIAEDWVRDPQKFEEDLSAFLWASKQHDPFRAVASKFAEELGKAAPPSAPAAPRWTVVVLGPELQREGYPLFRKLRPHGVFYPEVESDGGIASILEELTKRASTTKVDYGHWYIDGGRPEPIGQRGISRFSWTESEALREAVLQKAQGVMESGSGGPEMLRSMMANWALEAHKAQSGDALVDQFVMSVYGEGSGTQIFSTTFVQWAAREVLRRAEPESLVARFAPRQRQRTMNEMFTKSAAGVEPDFGGSLMDAEFGAYYTWINLNRLAGAENATFIAWSEAHRQAVAIGPHCPRGTEAGSSVPLGQLLRS
ncbi:MAG TPA: hypothetical protein VK716_04760 [Terracidiphilus sp.]|jgi:hypothetical protein|nr:hypothetical protein [Terracidiphilus sp.]